MTKSVKNVKKSSSHAIPEFRHENSGKPPWALSRPRQLLLTKPDRVMAAPGTFLECGKNVIIDFLYLHSISMISEHYSVETGFQSAHWAPPANLVVALESGVYVCKINEDSNVAEILNSTSDPGNPFCHVNSSGITTVRLYFQNTSTTFIKTYN